MAKPDPLSLEALVPAAFPSKWRLQITRELPVVGTPRKLSLIHLNLLASSLRAHDPCIDLGDSRKEHQAWSMGQPCDQITGQES